jgi:hypothetical protein
VLLIFPSVLNSEEEICDAFVRHRMAIGIQHAFLESYYNPAFRICRKRLLREFNEMNNNHKDIYKNKKKRVDL